MGDGFNTSAYWDEVSGHDVVVGKSGGLNSGLGDGDGVGDKLA